MSLLHAIEQYLGSNDSWPSSIIYRLFAETRSPSVVKELVAFFAGNGVPQTRACSLYNACNPTTKELVRQLFYARYSLWHTSDTVRRYSMYYDIRIKKHVRRDVSYFRDFLDDGRENSVLVPGSAAPKLGVENTATPTLISTRLELVRPEQL